MKQYILKIQNKENLTPREIEGAMRSIMSGKAPSEEIKAFLLALREKGPTIEEITGAAKMMRQFATKIKTASSRILDTCGTGGDKKHTFNISTAVALVVAGCGVKVAKHGNRSVSSRCGSADVLEGLGVHLNLDAKQLGICLEKVGIAFLFAQKFHPAMKNVASIRRELGVETIFNILGPLTNPAGATHQMMGVYKQEWVEPLCQVLKNLGSKRALVVHGADGLDEITTTGKTFISEFNGKDIKNYTVSPDELNFPLASEEDLKGGNVEENVRMVQSILNGEKGRRRDIVLFNAAFALYVAQKAKNIQDGLEFAIKSIDSKKALGKLEELKNFTGQF